MLFFLNFSVQIPGNFLFLRSAHATYCGDVKRGQALIDAFCRKSTQAGAHEADLGVCVADVAETVSTRH